MLVSASGSDLSLTTTTTTTEPPELRLKELLKYHSHETLRAFHARHRQLVDRAVLLLVVPADHADADNYELLPGLARPLHRLDERQYVLLTRADQRAMQRHPERELCDFMARHRHALFKIEAPVPTESRVLAKRARDERDETVDALRLQLALVEERTSLQLQHQEERHKQELQLQRQQLTIEFLTQELRLCLGASSSTTSSGGGDKQTLALPRMQNLTTSKQRWLQQQNLYGQDLSRLDMFNPSRWFGLFDGPSAAALTLDRLHDAVRFERVPGAPAYKALRVLVPLTYRYSLRRLLLQLAEATGQSRDPHVRLLVDACPTDYRVTLYGAGPGGPPLPNVKHAINCTVLALHLHLVKQAHIVNRRADEEDCNWSVRLLPPGQEASMHPHLAPSLELMALHYPAAIYSGANTYLLPDMSMPAYYHLPRSARSGGDGTTTTTSTSAAASSSSGGNKKKSSKQARTSEAQRSPGGSKGLGTGHNKNCPYCGQISHTLIQGSNYQRSHQLINCPAITLLSRNEAFILETLRRRAQYDAAQRGGGKKTNKFAEHDYLVGKLAKKNPLNGQLEFRFDADSLLRFATDDELLSGAHVNGLRLNRRHFVTVMCKDVNETLHTQLMGPLFGDIDAQVAQLVGTLYDMEEGLPLRSLLYDEFDRKFLPSRFDPLTKRPLQRQFDDASPEYCEDGLYFSLDSSTQPASFVLEMYASQYHHEVVQQQLFLNPDMLQQILQQQQQQPEDDDSVEHMQVIY